MKELTPKRTALCVAVIICLIAATVLAGSVPAALADGGADSVSVSVTENAGRVFLTWTGAKGEACSVLVNGAEIAAGLTETSLDITAFVPTGGRYVVAVVAAGGKRGETVFERRTALPSPNALYCVDGVLSWQGDYDDGTVFSVSLNGVPVGTTESRSFSVTAFVRGGDYTAEVTAIPADGEEYLLPSAPAYYRFSVPDSPLPPAAVNFVASRDRAYVVWSSSAEECDGYYVELRSADGVHISETVTAIVLDITAYVSQNKDFIFSVCCVKGGVRGIARSVAVPATSEVTQ